ncbi:hypothetical protein JaAD80_15795 [Janthinobacterium sp. AD80]|nr:hypothetical protein JaAD80_15795 [Janthinobacterium sp. AD80]
MGAHDDVDIVARQGETGHADHVVDTHGDGAPPFRDQRRQAAQGAGRRQLGFAQRLAAQHAGFQHAAGQFRRILQRPLRQAFRRPLSQAQHLGRQALAQVDIAGGDDDLALAGRRLAQQPVRSQQHRQQAQHDRQAHHQQGAPVFHAMLSQKAAGGKSQLANRLAHACSRAATVRRGALPAKPAKSLMRDNNSCG